MRIKQPFVQRSTQESSDHPLPSADGRAGKNSVSSPGRGRNFGRRSATKLNRSDSSADEAGPLAFLMNALRERSRREREGAEGESAETTNSQTEAVGELAGENFESVEPANVNSSWNVSFSMPAWKRLFDLSLIFATCIVWLPLMLLVMLLVRLSSPGPIFYRQERVGFHGRRFMVFKFRSMTVNADTASHETHFEKLMGTNAPMTKLDAFGDSRILPYGKMLRATGLDELPQLFNIIRGEMSLVGPRPCTPKEFSCYRPWQRERVNALPGLTGYWQVSGKNRTTFNEMIDMDIFYGKNMSLWLDLKIVLKTIPALIDQVAALPRKPRYQAPISSCDSAYPAGSGSTHS